MGESLESAIEKHYIQWKHLKPWQPKEGPQRHCQQRCPSDEADAHTPFCDGGGWQGHGDWAAHALQVQSITGSTQDRASDLWSRGFLPFWHPWPSGTMCLRAHVSENDKEQSNSFASQGLRVTRQEGAERKVLAGGGRLVVLGLVLVAQLCLSLWNQGWLDFGSHVPQKSVFEVVGSNFVRAIAS